MKPHSLLHLPCPLSLPPCGQGGGSFCCCAGLGQGDVTGGMHQGQGCSRELSLGCPGPQGYGLILSLGAHQGGHRVSPGPCSQGTKRRVFLTVTEVAN